MHVKRLLQLMLFYGVITYIVLTVIFNLPFMMEKHHFLQWPFGIDDFTIFLGDYCFPYPRAGSFQLDADVCCHFLSVSGYIWLR